MADDETWFFSDFGLLVTGKGERDFLPLLFQELKKNGRCNFVVIGRIQQLTPRTSLKKRLSITGTNKEITDKDFANIGVPARQYLNQKRPDHKRSFVLLIDDLEADRAAQARGILERYREALDKALHGREHFASVHFLVNMMEAYYFADSNAINAVLGTELADHEGDVEEIKHPKNQLKQIAASQNRSFNEVTDGKTIMQKLDVLHVLDRPGTCASLRTLFGWCARAMGEEPTERFCLDSGAYSIVTGPQIGTLG